MSIEDFLNSMWTEAGWDTEDVEPWTVIFAKPTYNNVELLDWYEMGATPELAKEWIDAQWDGSAQEAAPWINAGIGGADAAQWSDSFDTPDAISLIGLSVSFDDALYASATMEPDEIITEAKNGTLEQRLSFLYDIDAQDNEAARRAK